MKTKNILLVLLFTLSITSINAQIKLPKNNTVKNTTFNKTDRLKNLKLITGGNQGFVYVETANHSVGKKLANVEITFKSEKGGRIQKVKTNKYGNYKILLKPGRYIVTAKHPKYRSYSTAPGFSVVNNKYGTFNIPLQKLLQYPIKKQPYNIIVVFNTKTKKLIDIILIDKNNKRGLEKRPNTVLFYGTLTSAKNIQKNSHKKFTKGSSIIVYLNKKYLSGDQFLPGDQFTLFNTKFKIVSNTKGQLKMLVQ